MKMLSRAAGPLVLALALCAPAYSADPRRSSTSPQSTAAQTAAAQDEEEVLDEKLREFGYWSGAGYNCVADTRQPEVERQVIESAAGCR
jgi:hypothetical protein